MTALDDAFSAYLLAMQPIAAAAQEALLAPCIGSVRDAVTLASEQTDALIPLLRAIVASATPAALPLLDPGIDGGLWNQGGGVVVSNGFGNVTYGTPLTLQAGSTWSGEIGSILIDAGFATADLAMTCDCARNSVNIASLTPVVTRLGGVLTASGSFLLADPGWYLVNFGVTYSPDDTRSTGTNVGIAALDAVPQALLQTNLGGTWPVANGLLAIYNFLPAWGVDMADYTFKIQYTAGAGPQAVTPLIANDRVFHTLQFPSFHFAGTGPAALQLTAMAPGQADWTSPVVNFSVV